MGKTIKNGLKALGEEPRFSVGNRLNTAPAH